jgi:hypothetical protein
MMIFCPAITIGDDASSPNRSAAIRGSSPRRNRIRGYSHRLVH